MKKFLAILVCKLIRFVGSFVGRGSSLPGQIALKLCPDILQRVQLPPEKLSAYESISEGVDAAVRDGVTQAYTITCFSDKGKFLSLVNTL